MVEPRSTIPGSGRDALGDAAPGNTYNAYDDTWEWMARTDAADAGVCRPDDQAMGSAGIGGVKPWCAWRPAA